MSGLDIVEELSDEWFILQFLKEWNYDDICLAIEKDIDLVELMVEHPEEAEPLTDILQRHEDVKAVVGVGDVLYWFSVRRPDLYPALVESKESVEWAIRNFKKIKTLNI